MRDILGIVVATAGAVSGLVIILIKTDPAQASLNIILLFYFSLFLSIWGAAAIAGYGIRRFLINRNFIHDHIFNPSFVQGLIIAIGVIIFLITKKYFYLNF